MAPASTEMPRTRRLNFELLTELQKILARSRKLRIHSDEIDDEVEHLRAQVAHHRPECTGTGGSKEPKDLSKQRDGVAVPMKAKDDGTGAGSARSAKRPRAAE